MTYYTTKQKPKHPGNTTSPPKPTRSQAEALSHIIISDAAFARTNRIQILSGLVALPHNLVIGSDCKRKHGTEGKMLRTRLCGACICCTQFKSMTLEEAAHKLAMGKVEDRQIAKELWLDKEIGEDYPDIEAE